VSLKQAWRRFAERTPGHRFIEMHKEHRAEQRSAISRIGWVVAGVVITLVGIVALPAPGPGTLVLALGLGLIARESAKLARLLDRTELKLRAVWAWIRRRWRSA